LLALARVAAAFFLVVLADFRVFFAAMRVIPASSPPVQKGKIPNILPQKGPNTGPRA
jgi:hypothetical protein